MQDRLLQQAKIEAAKERISLTAFIEEAVEYKLSHGTPFSEVASDFKIITFSGEGLRPGVDIDDSADLLDKMDS